jgi:hypothetical protein
VTFFGADLISAVATVILAIFAIGTAWYARKAFLKQSQEVRAIERQVKDGEELSRQQAELLKIQAGQLELQQRQFDQDRSARRRAQAAQVFILIEDSEKREHQVILMATARNTSQLPVYDVWVQWRTAIGEFGTPTVAPQFLPGETKPCEVIWAEDAGMEGTDVSLDFRDAYGVRWRTTGRGQLSELCGELSPTLARIHCTFTPNHVGPHSWE